MRIAVAGCGPAGLAAAWLLARDGHEVVLFERFEAPQPVGSGLMLQPSGLAVLDAMGLGAAARAAGAPIGRLHGLSGRRVVLDVRYAALGGGTAQGYGIHRAALFDLLYGAVRAAGIPVRTGRAVAGSTLAGDGRHLLFRGGAGAGPFALVVDALGSQSALAPPCGRALAYGALWGTVTLPPDAGFDPAALAQRYVAARVMAGLLPLGGGRAAVFWSLRADRLEAWRQAGMAAWQAEVAALWPALGELVRPLAARDLVFARYAHRTLKRPGEARLVHLGDAWHSASPQLGQGANMALLDAWALARGLREAGSVDEGIARALRLRRRHVRLYQAMTALFTPVYQSDSLLLPWLRDRVMGPLSRRWPAPSLLAAMVAGLLGDPLGRLGLASPASSAANTEGHTPASSQRR